MSITTTLLSGTSKPYQNCLIKSSNSRLCKSATIFGFIFYWISKIEQFFWAWTDKWTAKVAVCYSLIKWMRVSLAGDRDVTLGVIICESIVFCCSFACWSCRMFILQYFDIVDLFENFSVNFIGIFSCR